jgi:proteasome lid subunit RPN8/RPN11
MHSSTLPRTLVNTMLRHAQLSPENEVCGLIGARDGIPCRCYQVANVAGEPAHLFQMDPRGQIDAMRAMRERGENLFAIYHSHPDSPPVPSETDLKEAGYPDALYLIISLGTKGVLEMRGWRLAPRLEEVALEIA